MIFYTIKLKLILLALKDTKKSWFQKFINKIKNLMLVTYICMHEYIAIN